MTYVRHFQMSVTSIKRAENTIAETLSHFIYNTVFNSDYLIAIANVSNNSFTGSIHSLAFKAKNCTIILEKLCFALKSEGKITLVLS